MPNENLRQVIKNDTNLLVSLYFLLRERKVSTAADKIFVGQPAMSHQLGKLRRIFNDRLLVRVSGEMMITPFARNLFPALEKLLFDMEKIINISICSSQACTPQKESYKVCVPDNIHIKEAATFLHHCAQESGVDKKVTFEITGRYTGCLKDLNEGVTDLFIGNVKKVSKNVCSQPLFESRWFWAVNNEHPLAGRHVTPGMLNKRDYIDIIHLEQAYECFSTILKEMRCSLKTSSFETATHIVQTSDAMCLLSESIIRQQGLSTVTLNNQGSVMLMNNVYWHKIVDGDFFHRKIRNALSERYSMGYPYPS